MKNWLVTGGAGFIGANFIHYVLNKYDDVNIINFDKLTYAGNIKNLESVQNNQRYTFVRGDVCDEKLVLEILQKYQIDGIVHFAAESHVDRSIYSSAEFVNTNIKGTQVLLDCAKDYWNKTIGLSNARYLQVSTDEVYGSLGLEGFFTENSPLDPHSPYSASKASGDLLVKSYFDTHNMPCLITRCSNNYGPYQFPEKLIPLVINNCLSHKPLPIYGDGLNVRDWLYVEDHCVAIDLVMRQGRLGEVYNIGGHNERTNIHIVKTIIDYLSRNVDATISEDLIVYVEDRKAHDRRYGIDPKKISDELGWEPATSFEEGIVSTIDWYLDNKKWLEDVTSGQYQDYYETFYGQR